MVCFFIIYIESFPAYFWNKFPSLSAGNERKRTREVVDDDDILATQPLPQLAVALLPSQLLLLLILWIPQSAASFLRIYFPLAEDAHRTVYNLSTAAASAALAPAALAPAPAPVAPAATAAGSNSAFFQHARARAPAPAVGHVRPVARPRK